MKLKFTPKKPTAKEEYIKGQLKFEKKPLPVKKGQKYA